MPMNSFVQLMMCFVRLLKKPDYAYKLRNSLTYLFYFMCLHQTFFVNVNEGIDENKDIPR